MNSKFLKITLSVIVVVFIVAGFLVKKWRENPNVMQEHFDRINVKLSGDFKTFANKEYGYYVKYPVEWPVNSSNPRHVVLGNLAWEPAPGYVAITAEAQNTDFEVFIEEFKRNTEDCSDIKEITVAGNLKAKEMVCRESFTGTPWFNYFIDHENVLYRIDWIDGGEHLNSVFKEMLSSFKFELSKKLINQITAMKTELADEMVNWKTYETSEYWFKIKYPASYLIRLPSVLNKKTGEFNEVDPDEESLNFGVKKENGIQENEIFVSFNKVSDVDSDIAKNIKNGKLDGSYVLENKNSISKFVKIGNKKLKRSIWYSHQSGNFINSLEFLSKEGDLITIESYLLKAKNIEEAKNDPHTNIFDAITSSFQYTRAD